MVPPNDAGSDPSRVCLPLRFEGCLRKLLGGGLHAVLSSAGREVIVGQAWRWYGEECRLNLCSVESLHAVGFLLPWDVMRTL